VLKNRRLWTKSVDKANARCKPKTLESRSDLHLLIRRLGAFLNLKPECLRRWEEEMQKLA
jgi:hypothetical protein